MKVIAYTVGGIPALVIAASYYIPAGIAAARYKVKDAPAWVRLPIAATLSAAAVLLTPY